MQTRIVVFIKRIALLFVVFVSHLAVAEENLTLKDVMQGLHKNMENTTYGIIMEDYDLIEKSAQAIATHPTPAPEILKKIVAHLGTEMPKFKGFDLQVHDTALELKKAAIEQNTEALLKLHNEVLSGCVGCHQSYRKPITDLLDN